MPIPLLTRTEILEKLLSLFRTHGYEGTSMSMISEFTGLGKASLYHHFPGGKEQMLSDLLNMVQVWFGENIGEPLQKEGSAVEKLEHMCAVLEEFYAGGKEGCLLASLSLAGLHPSTNDAVKRLTNDWIDSLCALAVNEGLPLELSKARAQDCLAAIQGGLLISRITGDCSIFNRTLADIPVRLLRPASSLQ
jgi:TetR/AcrR family transcriptional regulator, lmrAB and yxaGH operons repressor